MEIEQEEAAVRLAGGPPPTERPEVEFPDGRRGPPAQQMPEERAGHVVRRPLVRTVQREERGVELADRVVVRKKDLERAQQLELAAAGAVVPCAVQRPEMALGGGRPRRMNGVALLERPIEEKEELKLLLFEAALRPVRLAQQWPEHPGLVVVLHDRMGVERRPAVDVPVIAAPLDEKRPEVAVLVVFHRGPAVGVAEERPGVGFAEIARAILAGVERQGAEADVGLGRREVGLLAIAERPEPEGAAIVAGALAGAEQRPELETMVSRAPDHADERPRGRGDLLPGHGRVKIKREGIPGQLLLIEPVADGPREREERMVAGGRVAGFA